MTRTLILLGGLGLLTASQAFADDKPAPTTGQEYNLKIAQTDVADRKPQQYAPDGIRTDGFLIYPKAELDEQFSDNIYAARNTRRSDLTTTISPSVIIRSDLPRHEMVLSASSDLAYFSRYTHENTEHYNVTGTGKLDIVREAWLTGNMVYDQGTESRSSPDPSLGRKPTPVVNKTAGIGGEYRPSRFWLKSDVSYQRLDYDDVETSSGTNIANHLRDRDVYTGGVRAAYEIIPQYYAFVEMRTNKRVYDSLNLVGVNRNSSGYEERVGTDLELSGKLHGDVFVGNLSKDFTSSTYRPVSGLSFGSTLTWSPTALTTLKLLAQRTVEDTVDIAASSYLSTQVHLSADHELRRNIIVSMDGGFAQNVYQGDGVHQHVYDGGTRVAYKLNKFAYTGVVYHYYQRFSTNVSEPYHENRLLLSLGVQY